MFHHNLFLDLEDNNRKEEEFHKGKEDNENTQGEIKKTVHSKLLSAKC